MEQRTPEWQAARLGKATASRIADIVARTKSGYSTSRANYAAQLVCERLTGVAAESYVSAAMQWGLEKEPEAQRLYAFEHDIEVREVGFLDHPSIAMSGASPDGLARRVWSRSNARSPRPISTPCWVRPSQAGTSPRCSGRWR